MQALLSLTSKEIRAFNRCEKIIEKGQQTFVEVGNALLEIREGRYYRADYETFHDYCLQRWGFQDSRARQLIAAAKTVANVESVTTVTPTTERQARELNKLAPEDQPRAWQDAVETCEQAGEPVTAKAVKQAVERVKGKPAETSAALRNIETAINRAMRKRGTAEVKDFLARFLGDMFTIAPEDDQPETLCWALRRSVTALIMGFRTIRPHVSDQLVMTALESLLDDAKRAADKHDLEMQVDVAADATGNQGTTDTPVTSASTAAVAAIRLGQAVEPGANTATTTCPNCGGSEFDQDGDCLACLEPVGAVASSQAAGQEGNGHE
jgi:hypothetical protein